MERCGTRDIEGKATRVGASKPGGERVSIKKQTGETEQRIRKLGTQERNAGFSISFSSAHLHLRVAKLDRIR
jgi:hypothetical protein